MTVARVLFQEPIELSRLARAGRVQHDCECSAGKIFEPPGRQKTPKRLRIEV